MDDTILADWYQWQIAYQLYEGILGAVLRDDSLFVSAEIEVRNSDSGEPVVGFPVEIAGNVTLMTDAQGRITVPFLKNHPYRIEYWDSGQRVSDEIVPGTMNKIVIVESN